MGTSESLRTRDGQRRGSSALGVGASLRFVFLGCLTLVFLLVSLSACLLVSLPPCHGEEGESVPSFRRVLLSPERLEEELKRVRDGALVSLPLAEFDGLVQRAMQARTHKDPPRLLEARYHATLQEESLSGEGQWKLVHTAPSPGLLYLDPFNLALRQARFENGDALIADFDGKGTALLIETAGERTVFLDWSARAEAGREGLQFHLEIPPCPVLLLELDVPAGRGVMVLNDNVLLTGPYEAEKAELRRWKIVGGGRRLDRRIDIRILPADRPVSDADQPPAPLVRQRTTQKLHPHGLDATFELTLEGLARGVGELVCECDSELRLRDVSGPNVEGWSIQSGGADKPSRITIRLREAMRAGTWQILCLAPLNRSPSAASTQSVVWHSPSLRLVNGVPRGESLTLWLDPELRVESWDSGSFRLLSSDLDRATGSQVLTLSGGGLGPPRRPSAHFQVRGVEYRAHQLAWLHCDASGLALTVQIGWDVSQGKLFQLPVLLPADWRVEKAEMHPTGLMRGWRVRSEAGKSTLFVDLANPLAARALGDGERSSSPRTRLPLLTVQLRPGWAGPFTGKKFPLPDAVPLGARFREGALALDCDEQLFHLDVHTAAERSQPEGEGPWGVQPPEYYFRYRLPEVTSDPPVSGEVQIQARPPRLRAKCTSEVFVSAGRAAVKTHLLLEAEAGSPETIDLMLSAGDGGPWQWRNESTRGGDKAANRVHRAERLYFAEIAAVLPAFIACNPLQSAVLLAARPSGERWRLTLARPMRARELLRLSAQRYLQPHDNRWNVPLPVVFGADAMEGEVILHLAGAELVHLDSLGLREAPSPTTKGAAPWRTFRYGQSEVELSLSGHALAADHSAKPAIERARLVTYVSKDGTLRHHFSFQVSDWNQRTLSLALPPGCRPLAVQVNGRWLPRLLPRTEPENEITTPDELALPVPARSDAVPGQTVHRFEVVYTRPATTGMLWRSLDAPAPRLPVAPLAFQRVWRLAPKWRPLHARRYQSVPGTASEDELTALPHHLADLFRFPGSLMRWDPLLEDRQASVREALERAVRELGGRYAEQKVSLREAVSSIAFDSLKSRYPLLLDMLALREAGLGPDTILTIQRRSLGDAMSPWNDCGLIAVPARSAIVLTTNSGRGASLGELLSEDVERAVATAAVHGQDPSGRFHSVMSWLSRERVAVADGSRSPMLDFERERADWSEWEPVAGLAEDRMIVIRRDGVTAAGLALAFLLLLLLWIFRRRSVRVRLLLLLLALGLFGLGTLWLPSSLRDLAWWPLAAACARAALGYLRAVLHTTRNPDSVFRKPKETLSAAAVGGAIVLSVFGWHGRAAAPAPATVYLVPAAADASDQQSVLAPADLLDRLKELARPATLPPGRMRTVLVDASYEGRLVEEGKQAEFAAVFSAHSLIAESSTLLLPLSGVQLAGEVFLDGARADLQALPEPQTGYALKLRGRGRHKIELRFRCPVIGTAEDRNVLFTVPPLVRSRLSWRLTGGVSEPQILVKYGAQWTTRDAGGERLEADLGAVPRPVHLHWYQPGQATQATYQAAYLWDLGLENNQLTAWLRYHVGRGAVKKLEVELPAELEVSSATVQRIMPAAPPAWLTRSLQLRDWYVSQSGGRRILHLELPYPLSGDFQATLDLLPRTPFPSLVALPLPSPRGIVEAGPHYLAYRTHVGLQAQRENSQFLTAIEEKDFVADWPGVPRLGAKFPSVAYRITPQQTPKLLLQLHHVPPIVQAEVDLTVQVGPHLAEIQAVAEVKAINKDLAAIEWVLPSSHCTIAAVSGDEVRTWKQNGSRLLVWLNRMTETTRLRLSGWMPLNHQGEQSRLTLDGFRLDPPGKQNTRLRLLSGGDQALVSVSARNLQAVKSETPSKDGGLNFQTADAFYHLDCQVQSAANTAARVLTLAEVADRELRFTALVDYTIRRGELRHAQLRLRHWEEEKIEVQAEHVSLRPGPRRSSGERTWILPLRPGVRNHYRVTLRGSMPLDKAAVGIPMPEVLVQGVEAPEYYLAIAGGELAGQAKGSLQALNTPAKDLQHFWPDAAQRLDRTGGQAWRVQKEDWQLRLLPQTRRLEPTPVQGFLMEMSAAVVDGRRWLHEARCWLRHEAHADLNIEMPAPAHVLGASVDGLEVTPLQPNATRVWLPLPGRRGVRCVCLRWLYEEPEPLERPNLAPPALMDAMRGTVLWTVLVPCGWEVSRDDPAMRLGTGPARDAALALHRAEVQLHIAQELARQHRDGDVSAALADSQQRCNEYCRLARQALELGAGRGGVTGPKGQSLAKWLESLLESNHSLQAEHGEDKDKETKRRDKEKGSEADLSVSPCLPVSLSEMSGTPMSWSSSPDGQPLRLQLISHESQSTHHALAASGEWLGALAAVWILSFLPLLLARLRLFWPEQIGLLGVLGWYVAGLTAVVLLLLLAAACSRVFLLACSLRGVVRQRRKQVSTMTPGSGVIS